MASVEMYRAKVEELIRQADITTVSARGIRKQIETLTNSSLANVKREFDELVMEIYSKITDEIEHAVLNGGQAPRSNSAQNHHQQPQQPQYQAQQQAPAPQSQKLSFGGLALPPTSYVPPKLEPVAPSTNGSDEDEENDSDSSFSSVEEGNGRASKKAKTSSSSSNKKSSSSSKSKPKTKAKSATASKLKSKSLTKSSSKTKKDKDEPKVKRKQPVNEDGTPKVNNFTRPMIISDKLYEVIGHAGTTGPSGRVEMSRPEVVKQIWVYIKEKGLQAENDKRMINCDPKLKTLFGQDQVNCFSMNKYLSGHLSKPEELV
ncbi:hypothetical protein EDD21DRAFT_363056 [Dissophora ornata]|nr:hypothetical protein BGZ58_000612 [Dissophora ornata]KAI8605672.1 hypothetical protein EDD21DRAFT_363056 [Dissophora ornata]